jgi:hypothetical protein
MYHLLKLFLDLPRSDSAQGKHMGKESLMGGKILILHLLKLLLVFYSFQLCQIFMTNQIAWKIWETLIFGKFGKPHQNSNVGI